MQDYQLFRRCCKQHITLVPLVMMADGIRQQQQDFKQRHARALHFPRNFTRYAMLMLKINAVSVGIGVLLTGLGWHMPVTCRMYPIIVIYDAIALCAMVGSLCSGMLIYIVGRVCYRGARQQQDAMIRMASATVDTMALMLQQVYPLCWRVCVPAGQTGAQRYYIYATADTPDRVLHTGTQYLIVAADGTGCALLDLKSYDDVTCYQTTPNDPQATACLRDFVLRAAALA